MKDLKDWFDLELLKQPTTLMGIAQLILAIILIYTGHPDIGSGLLVPALTFIFLKGKRND